jgi:chromosome segregation ATPase
MSQASRAAWQLKAKHGQVALLQKQLQGCQMNLRRAQDRIAHLQAQLSETLESRAAANPCISPADRILADILQNIHHKSNGFMTIGRRLEMS